MTDHHLIIPPEELVDKWVDEYNRAKVKHHNLVIYIAGKASKWSADAELEACCEWVSKYMPYFGDFPMPQDKLRAARRPKPLTLGERIDAELAANSELSPELRALLIEAQSVIGEVVK